MKPPEIVSHIPVAAESKTRAEAAETSVVHNVKETNVIYGFEVEMVYVCVCVCVFIFVCRSRQC